MDYPTFLERPVTNPEDTPDGMLRADAYWDCNEEDRVSVFLQKTDSMVSNRTGEFAPELFEESGDPELLDKVWKHYRACVDDFMEQVIPIHTRMMNQNKGYGECYRSIFNDDDSSKYHQNWAGLGHYWDEKINVLFKKQEAGAREMLKRLGKKNGASPKDFYVFVGFPLRGYYQTMIGLGLKLFIGHYLEGDLIRTAEHKANLKFESDIGDVDFAPNDLFYFQTDEQRAEWNKYKRNEATDERK